MHIIPTHLVKAREQATRELQDLPTGLLSPLRAQIEAQIETTPPSNALDYLYARLVALDAILLERSSM